jgi:hypothetical protein
MRHGQQVSIGERRAVAGHDGLDQGDGLGELLARDE